MIKVTIPNGETLAYDKFGSGDKKLVLIHGNMSSSKMFDTIIERLEDTFTIYAIDMRGFGESTYNHEFFTLRELAEDLKMFFDAINLKDFYILGWSTGGGVCMEFVASNPEYVKGLIMFESVGVKGYPFYDFNENGEIVDATGRVVKHLSKTKEEMAVDPKNQSSFDSIKNQDKEILRHIWNLLIFDVNQPTPEKYDFYLGEMLKQRCMLDVYFSLLTFNISNEYNVVGPGNNRSRLITCPVLILQGDRDKVTPMQMGVISHKYLKNSELVILENSGHCPQVDCPDKVSKLIKEFIIKH